MKAKELKDAGLIPAWTNYLTKSKAGGITAYVERPVMRLGFFGKNWYSTGMSELVSGVVVDEFADKPWDQCFYAF